MLNKGFIGPIGDDLPSLIPLLFGLVMFFSTFTMTFSSFDARNTEFGYDVSVMRISRTLQSNSYIYNYNNFQKLCDNVGLVNVNYVAGISSQAAKQEDIRNIFDVKFFENGAGESFYCSNVDPIDSSGPLKISDFLSIPDSLDETVISKIFPLVVEDDKVVKPMHLFVVAWK